MPFLKKNKRRYPWGICLSSTLLLLCKNLLENIPVFKLDIPKLISPDPKLIFFKYPQLPLLGDPLGH